MASLDAQWRGVYAYAETSDGVTLFGQRGEALGDIAVRTQPDRRVFTAKLVDGSVEEAEVYQPLSDGRFIAPIDSETRLTASLADAALASTWAAYRVTFVADTSAPTVADTGLKPSAVATLQPCDSSSADTPLGCARPANTAVGCTNPPELPPQFTNYATVWANTNSIYSTVEECDAARIADCTTYEGGGSTDWTNTTTRCATDVSGYRVECALIKSANTWVASCPEDGLHCMTEGQYDAVPRNRSCLNPGSCTKGPGTIGCTPYH